jgi:hypothetical protein
MELSTTLIIVGVIILLIVGIVLFVVFSPSENIVKNNSGVAEWATSIQGPLDVTGGSVVATDKNGNIYMVGRYNANITINNYVTVSENNIQVTPYGTLSNSGSNYNNFIVKYNSKGQVKWVTNITGNLAGIFVATDSLNNVYVSGTYLTDPITINSFRNVTGGTINVRSYGTLANSGDNDCFLIKYDASGQALWATTITSPANQSIKSIAIDSFNNVYVSGLYIDNPVTINSFRNVTGGTINVSSYGTLANSDSVECFLVKYDASGQALWATSIGNSNVSDGVDINIDSLNNLYVTGLYIDNPVTINSFRNVTGGTINTDSYGTLANSGNADCFLVKYDASGQALWATSIGSSGFDSGVSVTTDSLNNVYVTGTYIDNPVTINSFRNVTGGTINTDSYGTLANSGNADCFLVKYDASGQALWATSITGSSVDYGSSVVTDSLNNVYVSGTYLTDPITINSFRNVSGGTINIDTYGTLANSVDFECFLVKYDTFGQALWVNKISYVNGSDLSMDKSNNLYLTGFYTNSSATVNNSATPATVGGTINPSLFGNLELSAPSYYNFLLAKYV